MRWTRASPCFSYEFLESIQYDADSKKNVIKEYRKEKNKEMNKEKKRIKERIKKRKEN